MSRARSGRSRIRELAERLESPSPVPVEASRFHALRHRLHQDLQGQLSLRLGTWGSGSEADRLTARVQVLEQLEDELSQLMARAAEVSAQADHVVRQAEGVADLAQHVRAEGQRWKADLASMGLDVGRLAEVHQDRARLAQVENAIGLHRRAIDLVGRGTQFLSALDEQSSQAIRARLVEGKERLLDGCLDDEWLEAFERALAAIVDEAGKASVAPPPPPPSEEMQRVPDLLEATRRWSRALGKGPEMLRSVHDRFGVPPVSWENWDQPEAAGYCQALQGIVDELEQEASALRRESRQALEDKVSLFQSICGENRELSGEMQRLLELEVRSPEKHSRWLQVAEEVENGFRAIAGSYRRQLEKGLLKRLHGLGGLIDDALARAAFSDEVEGLQELRSRIERLVPSDLRLDSQGEPIQGRLGEMDEILEAMVAWSAMERELERLNESGRANQAFFEQRLESLQSLAEEIRLAAERTGLSAADLSTEITAAGECVETVSVRDLQVRVDAIGARLEEQRSSLAQEMIEEIEDSSRQGGRLYESLDGLDAQLRACGPITRSVEQTQPIGSIADALVECRRVRKSLDSSIDEAIADFRQRRQEVRQHLEALPQANPYGRDRRSGQMEGVFGGDVVPAGEESTETLSRLREAVEEGERLLHSFYQDQHMAQSHREDLARRLTSFEREGLQERCPSELLHRVAALVYGIGESPADWSACVLQLEEARRLMGNLETHARRQAANEERRRGEA